MNSSKNILILILRNPITSILAMVAGIMLGLSNEKLSMSLSVYGEAYQILLTMTVLPILSSAIITSLARLGHNKVLMTRILGKMVFLILIMSLFFSIVGIGVGLIFKPGELPSETRDILSEQVSLQSEVLEIELDSQSTDTVQDRLLEFLVILLPENIFNSLASNQVLGVLVASILFGFALGLVSSSASNKKKRIVFNFFAEVYEIFSNIISLLIIILPFALVCILASEVATSGLQIFISSGKLIMQFYIFGALLLVFNTVLLSIVLRQSLFHVAHSLLSPSILAFTTRNSIASMTVAINTLSNKLGVNHEFSKDTMPLLIILGRFGSVFYFALVSIFSLQLYFSEINFGMLVFLGIGVVLAGIATAGATGLATIGILGIVMEPIGIPFETVLVILFVIDTIIDPLRTTLIVHTNTVLSGILYKGYERTQTLDVANNNV